MIGRLHGKLLTKTPPTICVDIHGLGYECDVPMSTFYGLPELGQTVTLFTHLLVREDAHLLFGFLSESERETFRTLLKVSGIGARTALAILSSLSVQELHAAVAQNDTAQLLKVPGIGKKTAERLMLELRGKFEGMALSSMPTVADSSQHDILQALLALGYSEKEVKLVMSKLPAAISIEEGIRMALQYLTA